MQDDEKRKLEMFFSFEISRAFSLYQSALVSYECIPTSRNKEKMLAAQSRYEYILDLSKLISRLLFDI